MARYDINEGRELASPSRDYLNDGGLRFLVFRLISLLAVEVNPS